MITWIIALIALVAIIAVFKIQHLKHKFSLTALILFLLFIGLTFVTVAYNNSISLKDASGLFSAVKLYFSWLGNVFDNLRVIVGNAIKMNWFDTQ